MSRKLIAVGNSFALTIDKKTCRLLRFDRETEFDVSIEDKDTLLVRPIRRSDRTGQPNRFQLRRTLLVLMQSYGMTAAHFAPLSHDGTTWRTFLLDADVGGRVDLTTVERLAQCLQLRRDALRRRETITWEETIARVLELVPSRPEVLSGPLDDHDQGTLVTSGPGTLSRR